MITLLERRALSPAEARPSGRWNRQVQIPSIQRDGSTYDAGLDRFLADLPLNGVRSPHSQRSYAYDLLVWVRFLDEARGKTVWRATRDDVDAYHRARRQDDAENRISAASWNRAVAALDKLYRWAVEEQLVAHSPFTYRDVWRRLTVDGGERAGARDRNGSRNALFADLLITTGLRLEEASSLLAVEIEQAIRASANGDKQSGDHSQEVNAFIDSRAFAQQIDAQVWSRVWSNGISANG